MTDLDRLALAYAFCLKHDLDDLIAVSVYNDGPSILCARMEDLMRILRPAHLALISVRAIEDGYRLSARIDGVELVKISSLAELQSVGLAHLIPEAPCPATP